VPKTASQAAVDKLYKALQSALAEPEVRAYNLTNGTVPFDPMNLAQIEDFYRSKSLQYQRLAHELGVMPK
jgi:tripartite-type tricarboxylate transporter receptor subunit TctC